jgi:6-phosphofructokinase 1
VLALGAASVATTYLLTNYVRDLKEEQARLAAYEERITTKAKTLAAQKANKEPSGTHIDDVIIDKVFLWEVEHLGHRFPPEIAELENTMKTGGLNPKNTILASLGIGKVHYDPIKATQYNKIISSHECVLADLVRKPEDGNTYTRAYVRAGPRKYLHFDPETVNAAIVTCGGLCPGLNNVVREITKTLCQLYRIGGKVYGIRGGYRGFYDPELPPIELTPELVEDIHHLGGTFLGSSRGGFDLEKIIEFIRSKKIKQLFVIGGDGTHRGAFAIHEGCMAKVSAILSRCKLTVCALLTTTYFFPDLGNQHCGSWSSQDHRQRRGSH